MKTIEEQFKEEITLLANKEVKIMNDHLDRCFNRYANRLFILTRKYQKLLDKKETGGKLIKD